MGQTDLFARPASWCSCMASGGEASGRLVQDCPGLNAGLGVYS